MLLFYLASDKFSAVPTTIASALWWLLFSIAWDSPLTTTVLVIFRTSLLLLFLRQYFLPWTLSKIYRHLRVQSVSLRSIRGLYSSVGGYTCRIDRIHYGVQRVKGARHIVITVDNFTLDIVQAQTRATRPEPRARRMSLADFAPSPVARRMWALTLAIYAHVEPFVRPTMRRCAVWMLRICIGWVFKIIQRTDFNVHSAIIALKDIPGTSITIEDVSLQTSVSITPTDSAPPDAPLEPRAPLLKKPYSVETLRAQLSDSFERTWERAWGRALGSIATSLKVKNVIGTTPSVHDRAPVVFLGLPGSVEIVLAAQFDPTKVVILPCSIRTSIKMSELSLDAEPVLKIADFVKKTRPVKAPPPPPLSISPTQNPSSAFNTPLSPAARFFSQSISPGTTSSIRASMSPSSPLFSPTSPLLEAISSSIRPRWAPRVRPKLQDTVNSSPIAVLCEATFLISSVRLTKSFSHLSDEYETVFRGLSLSARVSDPLRSDLHRRWLGRNKMTEKFDTDAYAFSFAIDTSIIQRRAQEQSMRLLTLGSLKIDALVSQWPPQLFPTSPFFVGDPNAAFLGIRSHLSHIEVTEHLHYVKQFLNRPKSPKSPPANVDNTSGSKILSSLPRIGLEVHCGSINARVICDDLVASDPLALELRTDGFDMDIATHFAHNHVFGGPKEARASLDSLPAHMTTNVMFLWRQTFIRARTHWTTLSDGIISHPGKTLDMDFADDPALLSVEAIELLIKGNTLGEIKDDENIVSLEPASTVAEIHCSTEVMTVELWHENVCTAALSLASLSQSKSREEQLPERPPKRLLDRLASGFSVTFAMGRFAGLVTAPDINPHDDLEISRGIALRTGIFFQYSSMDFIHVQRLKYIPTRTQTRNKLYLPEERIVEAIAAARASLISQKQSVFFRVALSNFHVRSAVATHIFTDEPLIAERDDYDLNAQAFLRVSAITLDAKITGLNVSVKDDTCVVAVRIPSVLGTFQLVHVYGALLAVQALKSFQPAESSSTSSTESQRRSPMSLDASVVIHNTQIISKLPTQRVMSRIDGLSFQIGTISPFSARANTILLFVLVRPVNRWEDMLQNRWEELLRLNRLGVSIMPHSEIGVQGDGACLRIPYGFVLSDLVTDLSVTVKGMGHLASIVKAGNKMDMRDPEAEGPKAIPKITVRLLCLSLEAADDPFESRLSLIWQTQIKDAAKIRHARDTAFLVKVATILGEGAAIPLAEEIRKTYQFNSKHSVSIDEARDRLNRVHSLDWVARFRDALEVQRTTEEHISLPFRKVTGRSALDAPNVVNVVPLDSAPPLFRAILHDVSLRVDRPSFSLGNLSEFLFRYGKGMPSETEFSLLVPMHLTLSVSSVAATLRNYPLPLLSIPPNKDKKRVLSFDTDLVVAEEMGSSKSVDWVNCVVVERDAGISGAASFSIDVPKTIMPVKTYANPSIRVTSASTTAFSWGVSYGPAMQDFMRVVDSLSSSPRDSSPSAGFWDKMRLSMHWIIHATFDNDVRVYLKGSRDPHNIDKDGAGFALSWQGNPEIKIGKPNSANELVQLVSDSMSIAIPRLQLKGHLADLSLPFRKTMANFNSGISFGIGFVMERTCGVDCKKCRGTSFQRACRMFDFSPHFSVKLEKKDAVPQLKSITDSYNGFRSDFIHMSMSLLSFNERGSRPSKSSNSLHLTPKSFAHFWSWIGLFDNAPLSIPIRQGSYYPARIISPKLGRYLATLKYRVNITSLFLSHLYMDDSRESWVDGVTQFVGVKALVDRFEVDMHQRDEAFSVSSKTDEQSMRHKPFNAVELAVTGIELCALTATFPESLKQSVPITAPESRNEAASPTRESLTSEAASKWMELDDFVETDWQPSSKDPVVHFIPVASCPAITYLKQNSLAGPNDVNQLTKFGSEDTHICSLGRQPSVHQVQIELAEVRINELSLLLGTRSPSNQRALKKQIELLKEYVVQLRRDNDNSDARYYMPRESVSNGESEAFENVYRIHSPNLHANATIRDILLRYYYCSRERRGFEYHLSHRAVNFIREQAATLLTEQKQDVDKHPHIKGGAAAVHTLFKFLGGDDSRTSESTRTDAPQVKAKVNTDPLDGWSEGVSLRKSHFCLLLKPQVVLRSDSDDSEDSVCVITAVQAKLASFLIEDDENRDDPINGKIMSRSYTSLQELQVFSPTGAASGTGCVPLEVLVDLRCESHDFDRLVPPADATFSYDKFNRLRLRNNVTSVGRKAEDTSAVALYHDDHLENQTASEQDLISVDIPKFNFIAADHHFHTISNIVTKLLLFSDAARKTRMDRLETLLFTYDFTDLCASAAVVQDLQIRIRNAIETLVDIERNPPTDMWRTSNKEGDSVKLQLLKGQAHAFELVEELNLIFDGIKLAQDRAHDQNAQKSALLLHASSAEIIWQMVSDQQSIAKISVEKIDFYWLSRRDSSTVNNLAVGNLAAFDSSANAKWSEIISKHNQPANHPLLKRGLFLVASWTILPPVGGITIYECFNLHLHPIKLQIDARLGETMMQYLLPGRKERTSESGLQIEEPVLERSSLDSPRALEKEFPEAQTLGLAPPALRRLGGSRSFTDLGSIARADSLQLPKLKRTRSISPLRKQTKADATPGLLEEANIGRKTRKVGGAAEMKTRSSQKSFVLVKISSLHLLLSIRKEGSFICDDARINTRALEYRNQTWSFEELVEQFIPSNMGWKGWLKMAYQQPLLPVLPVARELFAKTKRAKAVLGQSEHDDIPTPRARSRSRVRKISRKNDQPPVLLSSSPVIFAEPQAINAPQTEHPTGGRGRILSMFSRQNSHLTPDSHS